MATKSASSMSSKYNQFPIAAMYGTKAFRDAITPAAVFKYPAIRKESKKELEELDQHPFTQLGKEYWKPIEFSAQTVCT